MYNVLLFLSVITFSLTAHLPPGINICKLSDANVQKCMVENGQVAFMKLINGNEELGIPPLDPLILNTITAAPKPGPINIHQEYTNVALVGLSRAKLHAILVNMKKHSIYLEMQTMGLEVSGEYAIKGQLLLFPIDAKGKMKFKFDPFLAKFNGTLESFEKEDVGYLRLSSINSDLDVSKLDIDLGTIIAGNEQLDGEVHKIINDDPLAFFEVVKPAATEMWDALTIDIANRLFSQIPINEIFDEYS